MERFEAEEGRLQRLYGELGDEHLLDLADDADDLTDEARLALAQELRRRGLRPEPLADQAPVETVEPERESGFGPGIPGMFPSGASMMEQALEPPESAKDGLSRLISFYDGIELAKACALLEDAEMEPSIESIAGDALGGVPPRYEVWLQTEEMERATSLLRTKMGLFPLQEVEGEGEAAATGLVGVFDTATEAEEVRALLVEAGIAATVAQDDGFGEWEVTVEPGEQERAVAVVASGMGLQ